MIYYIFIFIVKEYCYFPIDVKRNKVIIVCIDVLQSILVLFL